MSTEKVIVEGFDLDPEADPFVDIAIQSGRTEEVLRENEHDRRLNDAVVDRKLMALKDRVVALHSKIATVAGSVGELTAKIDKSAVDMTANTAMTQQILDMISGGKMLVSILKFLGVMAVPITAIVTAWHLLLNTPGPHK